MRKTQRIGRLFNVRRRFIISVFLGVFCLHIPLIIFYENVLRDDPQADVMTKESFLRLIGDPWFTTSEELNTTYYYPVNDTNYHYEFRFQLNSSNNDHRLMIFIGGRGRTCLDYWRFPVGRRILEPVRSAGFSILVICSFRRSFDLVLPVSLNKDAYYIYQSLQKWINKVYFNRFHCYPRLYLHGVSLGNIFGCILARILPIQALLLSANPGYPFMLTVPSGFPQDIHERLSIDHVFANWFYFDYCYRLSDVPRFNISLCPFRGSTHHYFPLPPVYFLVLGADPWIPIKRYHQVRDTILNKSSIIGGDYLKYNSSIEIDVLPRLEATPNYMQKVFDLWSNRPQLSRILSEQIQLFLSRDESGNYTDGNCRCIKFNFTVLEGSKELEEFSRQKQEHYKEFFLHFKYLRTEICEEVCGDLLSLHAMSARNMDKAIEWINDMDRIRGKLFIQDHIDRPLRVWMYPKPELTKNITRFSNIEVDWNIIPNTFHMYTIEHQLQDYFSRLRSFKAHSNRQMIWAKDPLIADYYIIPSDLMFFYFYHKPHFLNNDMFKSLRKNLSNIYFDRLLNNMIGEYPYWTFAPRQDLYGSNHVVAIPGGRNMGLLLENTQKRIKNVVQLGLSGIRRDLSPPTATNPYPYRNLIITYRHGYDIIIPPFTPLRLITEIIPNEIEAFTQKDRLIYFAGELSHSSTQNSARSRLLKLWNLMRKNRNSTLKSKILGKQYETLKIFDGHLSLKDYIQSIYSSVFSLCPEGFLAWSLRLFETITCRSIPVILADDIVLPFERFIDWPSFTVKLNVSNTDKIIQTLQKIPSFDVFVKKKLKNAMEYYTALRWPYTVSNHTGKIRHVYLSTEDNYGTAKNVFYYIARELRCRRLEQYFGLTSEASIFELETIQNKVCRNYPRTCPCINDTNRIAFRQYF